MMSTSIDFKNNSVAIRKPLEIGDSIWTCIFDNYTNKLIMDIIGYEKFYIGYCLLPYYCTYIINVNTSDSDFYRIEIMPKGNGELKYSMITPPYDDGCVIVFNNSNEFYGDIIDSYKLDKDIYKNFINN